MANLISKPMRRRGTRVCRICRVEKPLTEFSIWMGKRGETIASDCRECDNGYARSSMDYHQLRKKPDRCEACKEEGEVVGDHCHASGLFRGWLCRRCNITIGHAKDDPTRLYALARYLETFYRSKSVIRLLETEEVIYLPI